MVRIKLEGETAVYHCISRVVGGQKLLDSLCQEKLVEILGKLSAFCGVEIRTYCMMSNHFHVLVRVPPPELSDELLLEKLSAFHGKKGAWTVVALESLKAHGRIDANIRDSVESRLGDVSAFMKEFKQRFSRWYNRQTGRFGTLWAERFASVLVEDSRAALRTVGAYIDLNPVPAGLVQDPREYRFCRYAAAQVGASKILKGPMSFLEPGEWVKAAAEYRRLLFVTAGSANRSDKTVLDPAVIKAELKRGEELGLGQVLRLRIRHFTAGILLGSKEFVIEMFDRHRDRFGGETPGRCASHSWCPTPWNLCSAGPASKSRGLTRPRSFTHHPHHRRIRSDSQQSRPVDSVLGPQGCWPRTIPHSRAQGSSFQRHIIWSLQINIHRTSNRELPSRH